MIRVIVIFIVLLLTFICGIGAAIEYYEDKINKIKREHEKELERLKKKNELLKSNPNFVYAMRNHKAIEYIMSELITEYDIKYGGNVSGSDLPVEAITPILDILKGEYNEED